MQMDSDSSSQVAGYNIPADLMDLIPGYMGRRDQDIADVRAYLQAKNFDAIYKIAHKLKGNGASFGFDKLSEIGFDMQHSAQTENFEKTQALLTSFENEVRQIKEALRL